MEAHTFHYSYCAQCFCVKIWAKEWVREPRLFPAKITPIAEQSPPGEWVCEGWWDGEGHKTAVTRQTQVVDRERSRRRREANEKRREEKEQRRRSRRRRGVDLMLLLLFSLLSSIVSCGWWRYESRLTCTPLPVLIDWWQEKRIRTGNGAAMYGRIEGKNKCTLTSILFNLLQILSRFEQSVQTHWTGDEGPN